MANLTRKQQQVYDFLRKHAQEHEHAPSLEEICSALGLKSRGSLHKHIKALEENGLVLPMHKQHRGVQLARPDSIPFLGYIAAGYPIEAISQAEPVDLPDCLRSSGACYVLGVKGDSMVDMGIMDGDWVVVEKQSQARNGQIVVALIDGEEATLKEIQQTADEIILVSHNSQREPMRFAHHRVQIQGVLRGLMRRY